MKIKIVAICVGLAIGFVLKLFVIDIHRVEGNSMYPSIKSGSYVIEYKLAYGLVKPFTSEFFVQWAEPKTGDVVFYVMNNHTVIKRCVASAMQELEFSYNSEYSLSVLDKDNCNNNLKEKNVITKIPLTKEQFDNFSKVDAVPAKMILAIGDNHADSIDSRDYGFVSSANVLGKALWK